MTDAVNRSIEVIISQVRDEAIQSCDGCLQSLAREHKSVIAKRWEAAMQAGDSRDFIQMVIADAVDNTIFHLLWAIDDGMLSLAFDGADLAEQGAGEMAGSYMGEWREAFSKERTYNDFKDL